MNKQYFAYIRVSTVKQGEGVSLIAQREAITSYAEQHSLNICKWFEEKETAAKQGRAQFTDMVKQLKAQKADGVVMHKIDRSARNLRDWATVGELQDNGIDVHFAAESVDFASRGGRLTADIQAVIAADYIRNLREETLKGINGRLKQGLYPFKAPIGYLDTGGGKAKLICPHKGPLVHKLFECYASGEHSLLSLVEEAARIGLKSFRGGRVTKSCIERMLSNPFYIGLIHIQSRKETFQGVHKPLIPINLYQRVQKVRSGKSVKKITKHNNLYRSMFKCGKCATTYCGEKQKGHIYYRCHTKGCTHGTVREERINQFVGKALLEIQISDLQQIRIEQHLGQWVDSILKSENTTLNAMQLGKVKQKQDQLLDAYLDGIIDKPTFETRDAQFLVREKELSERAKNQLTNSQIKTHIQDLFELMKSLYLTHSLANSAEKRQMLKILFSNRIITDKNVELEPRNGMKTATKLVTVLCGAHLHDVPRRGEDIPMSVLRDLKSIFYCPEWKQLVQLHKDIHARQSSDELPEITSKQDYYDAA